MESEKKIKETMDKYGCSRMVAISQSHLGKRSAAAERVLKKREDRKTMVSVGIDFETACKATR